MMGMKPKALERIEAKLDLLQHVQGKYGLSSELVVAAKSELGAELARTLAKELGADLLKDFEADIDRLERGQLQPGDRVAWQHGGEQRTDAVLKIDAATVVVDYSPGRYQKGYAMNRSEAKPADLDELRKLRAACLCIVDDE
jgi:hypothetical protein